MRKTNLLLIITLTLLALSCKKDENLSKKELLIGKEWIMTAQTVSPAMNIDGTLITGLYAQYDPCDKDDIGKFNSNGSYTLEEGLTKCDVSNPQVYETGTWTFNSDETIIVMTSSTGTVTNRKIQELTEIKIIITEEEVVEGIKYTVTTTFQKK